MRLQEAILVLLCFGLARAAVLGCMATHDHKMPTTTAEPRKCCPENLVDPASTAVPEFTPLLMTCPKNTQLLCTSQTQPTIIYANFEERILATSDGDETFSEVIVDCVEGVWQLEDDTEDMPSITKIRCDEIQ